LLTRGHALRRELDLFSYDLRDHGQAVLNLQNFNLAVLQVRAVAYEGEPRRVNSSVSNFSLVRDERWSLAQSFSVNH
jgi:hypothetical protein